mmetsp:Transcript_62475/g.193580  ORF Transcript_62475/g.193580 Transcript_62475/m.193580 type:complete len:86 (-) Transcript_62475:52-309(-)
MGGRRIGGDEGVLMEGIYYGKRFFESCRPRGQLAIPKVLPPIEVALPMSFDKVEDDWEEAVDSETIGAANPAGTARPIAAFESVD